MNKEPLFILGAFIFTLTAFMFIKSEGDITGRVVLNEALIPEDAECVSVKVPYEVYETVVVDEEVEEDYSELVELDYEIVRQVVRDEMVNGQLTKTALLEVRNSDVLAGEFGVSVAFTRDFGPGVAKSVRKVLQPGEYLSVSNDYSAYLVKDVVFSVTAPKAEKTFTRVVVRPVETVVAVQKFRSEQVCE